MTTTPKRPNLFGHGTSELCQDAFLCWLLEWAGDVASVDEGMHAAGKAFVELLYEQTTLPPLPAKIKIRRQLEKIDIVAEIGDKHVLAIEDKVHASERGNDLEGYRRILEADERYKGRHMHFVFLKTGDQSSYSLVAGKGWKVVKRAELLDVLTKATANTSNAILHDFHAHLEREEKAMARFRAVPKAEWHTQSAETNDLNPRYLWKGFFASIQDSLKGHWDYVSNPSGGFMGFWWGFLEFWREVEAKQDRFRLYLQLEEGALVVKMKFDSKSGEANHDARKKLQKELSGIFMDRLSEQGFATPVRLKSGASMTLARLDSDYRRWHAGDGPLDVEATLAFLQGIEESFKRVCSDSLGVLGRTS